MNVSDGAMRRVVVHNGNACLVCIRRELSRVPQLYRAVMIGREKPDGVRLDVDCVDGRAVVDGCVWKVRCSAVE